MEPKKPFESSIQDLVYNIDTGVGLRIVQFSLGFLALLVLILLFQTAQFHGLKDSEAMDSAQVARNLAFRGRFVTRTVRPASMEYLRLKRGNAQIEQHPDLFHAPLYPAVLAAGFKVFPGAFAPERFKGIFTPEQWIIMPINHLFVLMTGAFVFLIGKRLFTQRTALLGTVVYFLGRGVWDDSIGGTGLTMVCFFGAGAFYFALRTAERVQAGAPFLTWFTRFALSAAFATAAGLTRYSALLIIPGLLLYMGFAFRRRSWFWLSVFLILVVAGMAPWAVRNIKACGAPFGMAPFTMLNDSPVSEEDDWQRSLTLPQGAGNVIHAVQSKMMRNAGEFYRSALPRLGEGLVLFAFFIATFFFRFARQEVQLYRWGVLLSMMTVFIGATMVGERAWRLMAIFWPIILLYGLGFFFLLLDRLQLRVRLANLAVTGLVIVLTALPTVFALLPPRTGRPYPPYYPPHIMLVSSFLTPAEVMCTDMPWATAWYGDRTSIYVPRTLDEFYQINDYHRAVKGLYFTTLTRDKPFVRVLRTGVYKSWFPILEGRLPGDFPLTYAFPLNNIDQLFFSDRPRWQEMQKGP